MKRIVVILLTSTFYLSCATSNETINTASITQHSHPIEHHYAVGDTAQGGIVFMVNEDGTHGLVAALTDQFENASYNECSDNMNNPLYHDKLGKNYFDWRLPKIWEAYKLYMNLHMVNMGNFSNSSYWTSQGPSSFDKMSLINFSTGLEFASLKTDTYRARAIRTF